MDKIIDFEDAKTIAKSKGLVFSDLCGRHIGNRYYIPMPTWHEFEKITLKMSSLELRARLAGMRRMAYEIPLADKKDYVKNVVMTMTDEEMAEHVRSMMESELVQSYKFKG